MNDRKSSISPDSLSRRLGADAAPTASGVRRCAGPEDKRVASSRDQVERLPANASPESSVVVYCGNAREVSEGFTIALPAMGVGANIFLADDAPPATNSDREDN